MLKAVTVVGLITLAHSWYDTWCCSNDDCHPVDDEEIHTLPDAYEYHGMKIGYDSVNVKPSLDGKYHVCEHPKGTIRCLYVPGNGV